MWPHFDAVAKKCGKLFEDYKAGNDIKKYTTNGQEDKRNDLKKTKRADSPSKTGGPGMTMTSNGAAQAMQQPKPTAQPEQ